MQLTSNLYTKGYLNIGFVIKISYTPMKVNHGVGEHTHCTSLTEFLI